MIPSVLRPHMHVGDIVSPAPFTLKKWTTYWYYIVVAKKGTDTKGCFKVYCIA